MLLLLLCLGWAPPGWGWSRGSSRGAAGLRPNATTPISIMGLMPVNQSEEESRITQGVLPAVYLAMDQIRNESLLSPYYLDLLVYDTEVGTAADPAPPGAGGGAAAQSRGAAGAGAQGQRGRPGRAAAAGGGRARRLRAALPARPRRLPADVRGPAAEGEDVGPAGRILPAPVLSGAAAPAAGARPAAPGAPLSGSRLQRGVGPGRVPGRWGVLVAVAGIRCPWHARTPVGEKLPRPAEPRPHPCASRHPLSNRCTPGAPLPRAANGLTLPARLIPCGGGTRRAAIAVVD